MPKIIDTTYGTGGDFGDALYKQTLAGYGAREAAFQQSRQGIIGGYENLYRNQANYGQSEKMRLQQDFARQLANSQQSMVSRGLGNTTALDSAARGIGYDNAIAGLTLNDQLLQRQNSIAQQELQYMGQSQQGLAGLQGERLGWMGNVQGATQAQNFQGQQQLEQFGQQRELNKDQFGYQRDAAQQGFQFQTRLADQAFQNQRNYQNEFGFYNTGGTIPGRGTGDTVPIMAEPGEFVLSNDMVKALEAGTLDGSRLLQIIKQDRASKNVKVGYASGGTVAEKTPMQRMAENQAEIMRLDKIFADHAATRHAASLRR